MIKVWLDFHLTNAECTALCMSSLLLGIWKYLLMLAKWYQRKRDNSKFPTVSPQESYSPFFLTWPLSYPKIDNNNIEQGQNPGDKLGKADCMSFRQGTVLRDFAVRAALCAHWWPSHLFYSSYLILIRVYSYAQQAGIPLQHLITQLAMHANNILRFQAEHFTLCTKLK